MGISKRNPRGNFNWQSRILKKKAICCGQLNEPVDCDLFGPTLEIVGNIICKPSVGATGQNVIVSNTQPGQASTTLYEWYEGGPGGPLYYSSYGGPSSIEVTIAEQIPGTITYWIVVTNSLGCVTSQYLNIYVSNQPDVSITQSEPTDPCVTDPGNPFGQSSNGIITVTVNNPDPNALYYGYVIRKNSIEYETTDPLDTFSWTDLCFGQYGIKVKLYRLIDGVPTVVCSTGFITVFLGSLILGWDNIANVPVADPTNASQWNTFFQGPGPYPLSSFTAANVVGNYVYLSAGSTVLICQGFTFFPGNTHLTSIVDQGGYVTVVGNSYFSGCSSLNTVDLPFCNILGSSSFFSTALDSIFLDTCSFIDDSAFRSCTGSFSTAYFPMATQFLFPAGNGIFNAITGKTITITVPSILQTINAGGLQGDLVYLNANNTVTFIWV